MITRKLVKMHIGRWYKSKMQKIGGVMEIKEKWKRGRKKRAGEGR